ncbi:LysR substrate-binding domain-containing protein [Thalassotalea aquiviva]|uniref:LysR substrate-binding domain-containing protein n=1 Tax=Thalassotalea aquiviva TaxID=3242415 RepID=UPI00352B9608
MSLPITLEALLVLDAIDKRGSFAGAAEALNKVPSALSYIVQKLEEQLQVTLFQRQGRRSVLTPAGRLLLNEGRDILLAVEKLGEKTQTLAKGWEPKIRIGVDSIIDVAQVYPILADFLAQYNDIELDISEQVMAGSWESLLEDKVDLLIGAPAPTPRQTGVRTEIMCEISQAFMASPKHPLAQINGNISLPTLKQHHTIIVHDSSRNAIPRTSGVIEQSRHIYVPTLEYKIKAITAGLGVGFLPTHRVAPLVDSGQLTMLNLADSPPNHNEGKQTLYMAWKLVNQGKGLKALRDLIKARYDK